MTKVACYFVTVPEGARVLTRRVAHFGSCHLATVFA